MFVSGKHYTRLERLARDKHSSLLRKSVNYCRNKFCDTGPWMRGYELAGPGARGHVCVCVCVFVSKNFLRLKFMNVLNKLMCFQLSLMFASKARAYPTEAPIRCH